MMFEAIEVINKLFTGKDVKHSGKYFTLETTRLWTMPEHAAADLHRRRRPLHLAQDRRAGRRDHHPGRGALQGRRACSRTSPPGARKAGKDPDTMPKILQLHLSWAPTDEEALANAVTEWPNGGMKFPKQDIRSPFDFEQMAKLVRPEDFEGRMVISSDPDVHRASIQALPGPRRGPDLPAQRRAATRPSGSRSSAARCCRSCTGRRLRAATAGTGRHRLSFRDKALSHPPDLTGPAGSGPASPLAGGLCPAFRIARSREPEGSSPAWRAGTAAH